MFLVENVVFKKIHIGVIIYKDVFILYFCKEYMRTGKNHKEKKL